ncbi:Uncharacterised protein [Raoultella planticola]|nr:Uncharacterised protein [Raoultella planticola]
MPDTTAVSIKNVSKQFDNIEVLRDINLTVEKGVGGQYPGVVRFR